MISIKKYLTSTVKISDNHEHLTNKLNDDFLNTHELIQEVSNLFLISETKAKLLIIDWLEDLLVTEVEIENLFTGNQFLVSTPDKKSFFVFETMTFDQEMKTVQIGNHRVQTCQTSPKVTINLSAYKNVNYFNTLTYLSLSNNKFQSTIRVKDRNVGLNLTGCLISELRLNENGLITLKIICDVHTII